MYTLINFPSKKKPKKPTFITLPILILTWYYVYRCCQGNKSCDIDGEVVMWNTFKWKWYGTRDSVEHKKFISLQSEIGTQHITGKACLNEWILFCHSVLPFCELIYITLNYFPHLNYQYTCNASICHSPF